MKIPAYVPAVVITQLVTAASLDATDGSSFFHHIPTREILREASGRLQEAVLDQELSGVNLGRA